MNNLVLILSIILQVSPQSLPLNDYIWINYQKKDKIEKQQDGTYRIKLPCQAKIDACKVSYTQLPQGWSAADDGSLLVPSQDVGKYGGYVLKGTISSVFGDKANIDLVVNIQDDYYVVSDRNNFLFRNGYNPKKFNSNPLSVDRQFLRIENFKLQGFPSLDQVKQMIKTNGVYETLTYIKQLCLKVAPCQQKTQYLTQIYQALLQKIAQNNLVIRLQQKQIQQYMNELQKKELKKNQLYSKQQSDKSFIQAKQKIRQLQTLKEAFSMEQIKNQFLANNYYKQLIMLGSPKADKIDNQDQDNDTIDGQINELQEQIGVLEQTIANLMMKKNMLEEKLRVRRALIQIEPLQISLEEDGMQQENQTQLADLYQSKYRQYSQQALESKIKSLDIEQQIRDINKKFNLKSSTIFLIQQQIDQIRKKMQQKLTPQYLQSQINLKNINQVYILGADNIRNRIEMMRAGQCT